MSVHLDPHSQSIQPAAKVNQQQPVAPIQKRSPFGDSLEIRSGETSSWLDCFKNCFKAIWDFIQGLFSKKPAKEKVAEIEDNAEIRKEIAQMNAQNISAPTPESSPGYFRNFAKDDRDYTGIPKKDMGDVQFAENCCSFPKLALYLRDAYVIDMHEACRRINQAIAKDQDRTHITPRFVMAHHIGAIQQPPEVVGVQPQTVLREIPEPKVVDGGFYLHQEFAKNDLDFTNMPEEQRQSAGNAEHDCSYPKLAVYLSRAFEIGLMEAVIRINRVSNKHPDKNTLTPEFVMQHY